MTRTLSIAALLFACSLAGAQTVQPAILSVPSNCRIDGLHIICTVQELIEDVQAQYDALEVQIEQTSDPVELARLLALQKPLNDRLTAYDMAQLAGDTVALRQEAPALGNGMLGLDKLAVHHPCRMTAWRWLRGYRKPWWCVGGKR